jgi:serine/threonine protein kinase
MSSASVSEKDIENSIREINPNEPPINRDGDGDGETVESKPSTNPDGFPTINSDDEIDFSKISATPSSSQSITDDEEGSTQEENNSASNEILGDESNQDDGELQKKYEKIDPNIPILSEF